MVDDIKGSITTSTQVSWSPNALQGDGVATQHPSYTENAPQWAKVKDCVKGQDQVKERKTAYLPKPNPDDPSAENQKRYDNYLKRAVFYNTTRRTRNSMVGLAFKKDPVLTVPPALDYVVSDIDGKGVSIFQQSKKALGCGIETGRGGLLVDYPSGVGDASVRDLQDGLIRATCCLYEETQIINWDTVKVGAKIMIGLVVLEEEYVVKSADGFSKTSAPQWRVLRLENNPDNPEAPEDGVYYVELWRKTETDKGEELSVHETIIPRQGNGGLWEEIPFCFFGSENNDHEIDDSPLYDLSELNLAHYRNSADYEDSVFFTGQVQPWINGLDEDWRDWLTEQGLYVGSRSVLLLPDGSNFGMEQAAPNTMVKEAMECKEKQMVALGARLIEKGSAVKTATQAQSENEAETSQLALIAGNISDAYGRALMWMGVFMNISEESTYEINQDYIEHSLEPQLLQALVNLWQSGTAPKEDIWALLRKFGVIDEDKTDEEISTQLEEQAPDIDLDSDEEEEEEETPEE